METVAVESARTRIPRLRDARGRFVAQPGAPRRATRKRSLSPLDGQGRVRRLPSRDARGRFVAFPTTDAPSWYVLCADGYRIPGEAEVTALLVDARPQPQPESLPPARLVRRRRPAMRWEEVATWLLFAVFSVVIGWHLLHLQVPHH